MDTPTDKVAAAAASTSSVESLSAQRAHEEKGRETVQPENKFEPTLTFEQLRQKFKVFTDERNWEQNHNPRNLVLALAGEVGELCECFQWKGDHISVDDWTPTEREHLGEELSDVAAYLIRLADRSNIDLPTAIQDKIVKNARKYPAQLIDGSMQKYTAYEPNDSQEATSSAPPSGAQSSSKFEPTLTLEGLRKQLKKFVDERNWESGHTPRNLVLALTGEMGELCECFQWKGDHISVDDWTPAEREHLGEELSDVAIYLVRLADRCNVDFSTAILDKIAKNARKYPAHLVNGSAAKYTAYIQPNTEE